MPKRNHQSADLSALRAEVIAAKANERQARERAASFENHRDATYPRTTANVQASLDAELAIYETRKARWHLDRALWAGLPVATESQAWIAEHAPAIVDELSELRRQGQLERCRFVELQTKNTLSERRQAHNDAIRAAGIVDPRASWPALGGTIAEQLTGLQTWFRRFDAEPAEQPTIARLRAQLDELHLAEQMAHERAEADRVAREEQAKLEARGAEQRKKAAKAQAKALREKYPDAAIERERLLAAYEGRREEQAQ